MKIKKSIHPLVVGAFMLSLVGNAQDAPLDQIVEQLPVRDPYQLSVIMEDLAQMGEVAVLDLSDQLTGTGQGDDNQVRYAISGLAKFLGQSQDQAMIATMEEAFLDAIDRTGHTEIQAFLLEQLQYFATSKSLPRLGKLIRTMCDPAIRTILQIGSDEALKVLLDAYPDAGDYCKQSLTKAYAQFEETAAGDKLQQIATQSDLVPKSLVLPLLAKYGRAETKPLLQSVVNEDPDLGTALLLDHAEAQAKMGKSQALIDITSTLIDDGTIGPNLSKALSLLTKYDGTSAEKMLVSSFRKASPALARVIIEAVGNAPNMSLDPFFNHFKKVEPAVQGHLLRAAVQHDYKLAAAHAESSLQTENSQLKRTAVRTLSSLNGPASIPSLMKVIETSKDPDMLATAVQEVSRWIGKDELPALEALFDRTSGPATAGLIKIVAERGLTSFWPRVQGYLSSSDPLVQEVAYRSMPRLAVDLPLASLAPLSPQASTEDQKNAVARTLVAKIQSATDHELATGETIRLLGGDPSLMRQVLPAVGGRNAMKYVNEKFASEQHEWLLNWQKPEAIGPLLGNLRTNPQDEATFTAILRLANHRSLPAAQKLLVLRELLSVVDENTELAKRALRSLATVKSHTALVYVSQFLDDDLLKNTAAEVIVSIALPPAGESAGLYGSAVRHQLMRADTILADSDQEYTQAFLHNYLRTMPKEEGFISLFNGKDFEGWKGLVANPIARDTMFGLQRQQLQREADEKMKKNWTIRDGHITFVGEGYDNICSDKKYRDFEMLVDWRIGKDGDSGIYLRGTPQVQIWDTSRVEDGAQVGSGGLYNNQEHESKPLKVADNPVGEWNTFRIIMIDDKVTVYLNGELVTDRVVLENYWDRSQPISREEQVELQAHGTDVQFRDVYIREINNGPDLSSIELREGFRPLFNGVNLDGWIGNKIDYVVENGEIVIYPGASGGQGNLYTEEEYDNFRLRFEFKLTPGANNGLGIHAPLTGDAAYEGKELQILDNSAEKYANLKNYQYHGSVYGLVPAERGALKPVGEWNEQEVVVKGNRVTVVLNGRMILSADLDAATRNGTLDGRDHPGLQRLTGHIGFLGHGSEVHFRNIRILEIEEDD